MKILIDQNLPARLVRSLEPLFPGSTHVNAVGLGGARDIELWNFALKAIESSLAEVHQALGTRSLRIIEIR